MGKVFLDNNATSAFKSDPDEIDDLDEPATTSCEREITSLLYCNCTKEDCELEMMTTDMRCNKVSIFKISNAEHSAVGKRPLFDA